ncbi:bifunctional glutamate N-acetyltransferase/amino-acid acetyltransferase ArgJ [Myxococcaceae bacterium GXIMD 01537]
MSENSPLPRGFRAASAIARVKPKNTTKPDLALLVADEAGPAHALFTRNELVGAHVHVCREYLARSGGKVRAVLVNAGNANCATGQQGIDDAKLISADVARRVGCPEEQVLYMSTGVIGARLPVDRIQAALPGLVDGLAGDGLGAFSRAIMTTDTFPKARSVEGAGFRTSGTAKGAGMIHPDMATMLGFLLTDAAGLGAPAEVLRRVADRSFHRVTIDGDTSPNDTLLLWSSGKGAVAPVEPLEQALTDIAQGLSRMIARDGEGATRLVTVQVRGARTEAEAAHVGRVIGTSPLVKTAVHGLDPNWGRILAAAGRAGVPVDVARARVWIGASDVYAGGKPHPENEAAAHEHMKSNEEVILGVDLATGSASADVWTCDYSAEYVSINADYRS